MMNTQATTTAIGTIPTRRPTTPEPRAVLPSGPVTVSPSPALFSGWTIEELDLIRRTIAPDATEYELALYLRLCKTYGLDPFRRELVMEKRRRKRLDGGYDTVPVFITTRDGYLKAAKRDNPDYGGLISGVVCEGDHFEYIADEFKVIHRFGAKRGPILGAWAIAYHRQHPPTVAFVPFKEYFNQNSDTWQRTPSAMIQKVAEVFVLRRQYGLSGIVAREEMDNDPQDAPPSRRRKPSAPTLPPAAQPEPALPHTDPDRATETSGGRGDARRPGSPAAPNAPASVSVPGSATGNGAAAGPSASSKSDTRADAIQDEGHAHTVTPPPGPNGEIAPASPSRPARMPAGEFRALIHKAAIVQNVKSATPGKTWLRERYSTDNPAQLTDAQYEDAIRQALAIVSAAAPGPQLAAPGSIAALQTAFDRLRYDEPGRLGLIRACTNDRTDRAEEMTEVEIRALIDELNRPVPGTPANASAAGAPSASVDSSPGSAAQPG